MITTCTQTENRHAGQDCNAAAVCVWLTSSFVLHVAAGVCRGSQRQVGHNSSEPGEAAALLPSAQQQQAVQAVQVLGKLPRVSCGKQCMQIDRV